MFKRRLAGVLALAVALVLAASGTASAADDNGWDVVHVTSTPTFVISGGSGLNECPNLPVGETLTSGQGTRHDMFKTRWRKGVFYVEAQSVAQGVATDSAGRSYRYHYVNRVSETSTDAIHFSGTMTDAFSVTGNGPHTLRNGFVANLVEVYNPFPNNNVFFALYPTSQFGDPFAFPSGGGKCDPI